MCHLGWEVPVLVDQSVVSAFPKRMDSGFRSLDQDDFPNFDLMFCHKSRLQGVSFLNIFVLDNL